MVVSTNAPRPDLVDGVEVIRMRYLEWQKEVRQAVLYEGCKRAWLPTAARAGKDRASAMIVAELILVLAMERQEWEAEHGSMGLVPLVNVWVVAPTKALFKQCWSELVGYLPKSLIVQWRREEFIGLKGGISISFKSADTPETLVSEGVDIIWVTEASRIKSDLVWYESLIPRLASPGRLGVALINGSPRNAKSHWFRRSCERAAKVVLEAAARSKREGKTIWPEERVWQLPMSVNPLMIDKMPMLKETMPARLFNSECLGLWPDDEEKPFPDSYVQALIQDEGPRVRGPFKIAIDVSRTGQTFVTRWAPGENYDDGVAAKPQVVDAMSLRDMKVHKQIGRIVEFIRKGPGRVMVDCTGAYGLAMQEALERTLGQKVEGYDFHGRRKEALIEGLIIAVEQGSFIIRRDLIPEEALKEMIKEFEDFDCEVRDDGSVEYKGEPDDAVDSVAIGWFQSQHGFGVINFDWQSYLETRF